MPLLDEALLSLREKDRTALLLRFYENHSLREVGAAFGVSEDTARKRVQSALEKLTEFFKRRGFKTAIGGGGGRGIATHGHYRFGGGGDHGRGSGVESRAAGSRWVGCFAGAVGEYEPGANGGRVRRAGGRSCGLAVERGSRRGPGTETN